MNDYKFEEFPIRALPANPGAYQRSVQVSVVIPTYKRHNLLRRCLAALIDQDCDLCYEVIVADDEGNPAIAKLVAEYGPRVRYLLVTGAHGPAAARNVGWRAALGQAVAFTDDDTIPDPSWLHECYKALGGYGGDCGADAVWGHVNFPLPDRPTDFERNESGLNGAEFVTANVCMWKVALTIVGGFDERFRMAWREDTDVFYSLVEHGLVVKPAPKAVVNHPPRPGRFGVSLGLQKKAQYNALLYKKHPVEFLRRMRPLRQWGYYTICLLALLVPILLAMGQSIPAGLVGLLWLVLVLRLAFRRIAASNTDALNALDILVTSPLLPILSTFWRVYGAVKFRVFYF